VRPDPAADPDASFASYAVARWSRLVRVGVLLGATPERARELARTTLTRCAPGWERANRESDVDAWTYATLLELWRDVPATERDTGVPECEPTHPDPDRARAALADLLAILRALPDERRAATVLAQVAGLDDSLASSLAGKGQQRPAALRDDLLLDGVAAVPVGTVPVDEVLADVAATRRRRRLVGLVAVVVVLAAVGVLTWATRGEPPRPRPPAPDVVRTDNPAPVPWYANGDLHVARAVVTVPGVTALVDVPDGAVYADEGGHVVLVSDDGEILTIGRHPPGDPVVGSEERGWVAWTTATERGLDLVVYDTRQHREIGRHVLDADPGDTADDGVVPVAVDQEFVYYRDQRGQWKWQPGTGGAEEVAGAPLVDVAAAVQVSDVAPGILTATQPLFDAATSVRGNGGLLSPDGTFLITHVDQPRVGTVRVYDVRDGSRLDSGLRARDIALAATFTPDGDVLYVVAHRPNAPVGLQDMRLSTSGPQVLASCRVTDRYRQPGEPLCRVIAQVAANGDGPLLPG
jgi:hypothetical protein